MCISNTLGEGPYGALIPFAVGSACRGDQRLGVDQVMHQTDGCDGVEGQNPSR